MDDVNFLMKYWAKKARKYAVQPSPPPGFEDVSAADLIAAGIMVDNMRKP